MQSCLLDVEAKDNSLFGLLSDKFNCILDSMFTPSNFNTASFPLTLEVISSNGDNSSRPLDVEGDGSKPSCCLDIDCPCPVDIEANELGNIAQSNPKSLGKSFRWLIVGFGS
uniref:Uncharacterized protein n=1 Tax=Cacopsylla melanoneura TaxID=428564 RepID=A0A8D8V515_9HEMI